MCGIVGICSTEGLKGNKLRKSFFMQALYVNTVRGIDSTGIFAIPENPLKDDIIIQKKAMPAHDFLDLIKISKIIDDIDKYPYMIGHNRAATKGGITHKTAHPFSYGDITLVHNGTLNNQYALPEGNKFTVDSEALCNAISLEGYKKILPTVQGAFALVWHDNKDNTLKMVRNDERTLSFGFIKGENTMVIASEAKMLSWLAHRNGLVLEEFYSLTPGWVLTFDKEDFRKYTTEKIELWKYTAPPPSAYSANDHYYTSKEKELCDILEISIKDRLPVHFKEFEPYNKALKDGDDVYGSISGTIYGKDGVAHKVQLSSMRKKEVSKYINRYAYVSITSVSRDFYTKEISVYAKSPILVTKRELKAKVNVTPINKETVLYKGPKGALCSKEEIRVLVEKGCGNCMGLIREHEYDQLEWDKNGEPICPDCTDMFFNYAGG